MRLLYARQRTNEPAPERKRPGNEHYAHTTLAPSAALWAAVLYQLPTRTVCAASKPKTIPKPSRDLTHPSLACDVVTAPRLGDAYYNPDAKQHLQTLHSPKVSLPCQA
jgi:hypothetical protein